MPNTRSGLCNVINCEISGGKWLIYVKTTVLPAKGRVRGMNSQTPRRRMVLFRGVCCFLMHFYYFSSNLFGGKKIFRIFANSKGCCNKLSSRVYKCKQTKNVT